MRATVIFVSDDQEIVQKARAQYETDPQIILQIFTNQQWSDVLENDSSRASLHSNIPRLSTGLNGGSGSLSNGGRVLSFPSQGVSNISNNIVKVEKIEDLEAKAIESAINQYRGNLTEAARALGIGRATLYRKVKQYQIDPSAARRKRVA